VVYILPKKKGEKKVHYRSYYLKFQDPIIVALMLLPKLPHQELHQCHAGTAEGSTKLGWPASGSMIFRPSSIKIGHVVPKLPSRNKNIDEQMDICDDVQESNK
jgi:hypothetical protein